MLGGGHLTFDPGLVGAACRAAPVCLTQRRLGPFPRDVETFIQHRDMGLFDPERLGAGGFSLPAFHFLI